MKNNNRGYKNIDLVGSNLKDKLHNHLRANMFKKVFDQCNQSILRQVYIKVRIPVFNKIKMQVRDFTRDKLNEKS